MSRKRHRYVARPVAGAAMRLKREGTARGVLLNWHLLQKAWTEPVKPWKDKQRGWVSEPRGGWKMTGAIQASIEIDECFRDQLEIQQDYLAHKPFDEEP